MPEGESAGGTYVSYDHEALIGILCLEAYRAGAVVIGEDLGVVQPFASGLLRERGILGTSILVRMARWRAFAAGGLSRAVPGERDDARPAADRGVP